MIEIVQAPNYEKTIGIKLFIAGGISNCINWQIEFCDRINNDKRIKNDIIVFNPRCKEMPEDEYAQTLWEFERLRKSDIISFWFSEGSVNPITLFEYGRYITSNKQIIIGCDPNYTRKSAVMIQTKLERPWLKVNESFEDFYENIIEILENYEM